MDNKKKLELVDIHGEHQYELDEARIIAEDEERERIKALPFIEKWELVKTNIDEFEPEFLKALFTDIYNTWKNKDNMWDALFDLGSPGQKELNNYLTEMIYNERGL